MTVEAKTGLTLWDDGILQPDLLFNALLYWVAAWAQPIIIAIEDDPPVSPADADMYLVGTGTGAWIGHDDDLAYWDNPTGIWVFFEPHEEYRVTNLSDSGVYVYSGSNGWSAAPGGLGDAPSDGSTYGRNNAAWVVVGAGSGVASVVAGHGIDVDATDPDNPIVAADETELDAGLIPFSHTGFTATNVEDAIAEAGNPAGGVSSVNGDTGAVVLPVPIGIACSDETTNLTTGAAKVTFRMPYAMTLLAGAAGVRASLSTAQAAGSIFTVDINENGTTILSTKITIDNSEKTSTTAATPAVISDTSLADDAEITVDIDQVGTPLAKGLKIWLIGYPT